VVSPFMVSARMVEVSGRIPFAKRAGMPAAGRHLAGPRGTS
jgi:hypothetical protein